MFKRILVATDGSALSGKAVDQAIGLARALGAGLFALKVVHLQMEAHWDGELIHERSAHARREAEQTEAARAVVEAVRTAGAAAAVQVTPLTVKAASVADAVIDTAQKNACDLIVMASHGRRGLARVLLGSETQHVLTHSQIPVLVLR
ncbi:MAG: universal stress protein [Ramlibacter sp.]|jgi:nucleotide-binding universal stress UspA family protein|nr:universal stress protein [Ramlibacter sp.]